MQGQIGIASDTDRFAGDRNRAWAGRHPAWQLNGQFGNKLRFTVVVCFVLTAFTSPAQNAVATKAQSGFPVLEFVQNKVEVLRFGSKTWDVASTDTNHNTLHSGDRLRTGENSRVGLRLPEHRAMLILDANSYLIVPNEPQEKSSFELLSGRLFNFHRGTADEQRFKTPTVSAIVRGTDFELEVKPDNTTIVSMIDGQVYLKNSFGQIELKRGNSRFSALATSANFAVFRDLTSANAKPSLKNIRTFLLPSFTAFSSSTSI